MILQVAVIFLSALGFIQAGRQTCQIEAVRSCKDVLKKHPDASSGVYNIDTNVGPLNVYCEMKANGGGYTFLPKSAITVGTNLDLSAIYTESSGVLLRFQRANQEQPFAVLEQLARYQAIPLSVQLSSFNGYTQPKNTPMGAFLYLGFILNDVANQRTIQGITSEGVDITFTNGDSNPNSYFALFPNPSMVAPNRFRFKTSFTSKLLGSSLLVPSYSKMQEDYFFFTEIHFGGGGVYESTDQWTEVNAMAIGLR